MREKRMKKLTLNTKMSYELKQELLKRNPVDYEPLAQGWRLDFIGRSVRH